mgnify:FL=1
MKKACVLLVLVACGGGSSATPDAAPDSAATADASPDGADGCSGAQMVTVEGPAFPPDNTQAVMLTVVSHDATGAMCNQATGSGSEAQLAIATPPGGMVPAVLDVEDPRSHLK